MANPQSAIRNPQTRRGGALLWTVAALALAAVMAPAYVSLCHSLSRMTARNGHRLIATQRGLSELERLRSSDAGAAPRAFAVPELPQGRGQVSLRPGSSAGLLQADLVLTWDESGSLARAEWTTLVPGTHHGDTETRR